MAFAINKRHQARNEKALQELIRTVHGNDRCADCQARNPGWASWSLGIFLCMRCAALHRKLGTHISKVKSLSMDSWSNDQVENMKRIGNTNSNLRFNPKNTRPPIPLDADEVDSAMERFIRQKYEQKALTEGGPIRSPTAPMHTGSTMSSDDNPPPPPPKPGLRFGFGLRSVSSALTLGRGSQEENESVRKGANIPPIKINQPAKVIGASIGVTEGEQGLEWKLLQLREMGFQDNQKNTNILKGLNGDLERTIESLVKLREGSTGMQTPGSSQMPSRQPTPNPPFSAGARIVSAQSTPSQTSQRSPPLSARSNNPFDVSNPPSASQPSFESAFATLNLTSPQPLPQPQTLFPNATGGHQIGQVQTMHAGLNQSMTPPIPQIPQIPQQYANVNNPYAQQSSHNPFVTPTQQPSFPSPTAPNSAFSQLQQGVPSPNPFINQPSMDSMLFPQNHEQLMQVPLQQQHQQLQHSGLFQSPSIFQQQQEQQQSVQHSFVQSSQFPQQQQQQQPGSFQATSQSTPSQPFTPSNQPPLYAQPSPYGPLSPLNLQSPLQQMQPLSAQPTGRLNKSGIMALYNYPQLSPTPVALSSQTSAQNSAVPSPQPQTAQLPPGVTRSPQRSVTMPVSASGNRNPFLSAAGPQSPPAAGGRPGAPWHESRESSDSGRHSPDAFASLSARFVR